MVSSPKMPDPPDPVQTANAQGQINADTARLTQRMNLIDQVGPDGTVRYRRIGPAGTGTAPTVGNTGTTTPGTTTTGTTSATPYGSYANGAAIDQNNFDWQKYLDTNTDVRDVIGQPGAEWLGASPQEAAWKHYTQYGMAEGRTWDGGPAAPTTTGSTTTTPRLNIGGIGWGGALANGVIDPYQGLAGGKAQYDTLRRGAGFQGEFGNNAFETWLRSQDRNTQVNYINSMAQAGGDPDYLRTLIQQLPGGAGADPYSTDNMDRWEQYTELDPVTAQNLAQQKALTGQLLGLATGQATRVGSALNKTLDTTGLPDLMASVFGESLGGNSALANGQIDPYVGLGQERFNNIRRGAGFQGEFGGGQFESWLASAPKATKDAYIASLRESGVDPDYLIQLGVQPDQAFDLNRERNRTEAALRDRMTPQMERRRTQLETQLINQGIPRGSDAWKEAMDDIARQENDLGLSITAQSGDELARMFGMKLSDAQLRNSSRSQGLQERSFLQNTPINQISALLSGSQVSLPQATIPAPQVNVNPADYSGNVYQGYQGALQAANAKANNANSLFGNLAGLGGALGSAWILSDKDAKEDIEEIDELDNGLPVYSFRYKGDGKRQVGLMAQDVEKRDPKAVGSIFGMKVVDYNRAVR